MYLLAATCVTVDCSRAKAFDYAANLENFADWFPGVINIAARDELSTATTGKEYLETVLVPLRGERSVLIRVVDARAPRRLITEGDLPLLLPRMEIEFGENAPRTCTIHWRMLSRNKSTLLRWTVLPAARVIMRRRARLGLRNLQRLLEGGTSTAHAASCDPVR